MDTAIKPLILVVSAAATLALLYATRPQKEKGALRIYLSINRILGYSTIILYWFFVYLYIIGKIRL